MFEIRKLEEDDAVMLKATNAQIKLDEFQEAINQKNTDQTNDRSIKQRQIRQECQEGTPDLEEQIKMIINQKSQTKHSTRNHREKEGLARRREALRISVAGSSDVSLCALIP